MNSQTAAYDAGTVHTRANCVTSRKRHAADSEFEGREELPNLHFRSAYDLGAAIEYATDFWQRSLIFLDILRQSGNQQAEMTSRPINAVLIYDYEVILRGTSLPRPVNYALVRVVPPRAR